MRHKWKDVFIGQGKGNYAGKPADECVRCGIVKVYYHDSRKHKFYRDGKLIAEGKTPECKDDKPNNKN